MGHTEGTNGTPRTSARTRTPAPESGGPPHVDRQVGRSRSLRRAATLAGNDQAASRCAFGVGVLELCPSSGNPAQVLS